MVITRPFAPHYRKLAVGYADGQLPITVYGYSLDAGGYHGKYYLDRI
jgi:hypothetical protein